MYSVHSMLGLRQGKIEFVGTGSIKKSVLIEDNDLFIDGNVRTLSYADFIIEKGHEDCLILFFDYLKSFQEKWTCAELCEIPENQFTLSYLSQLSNKTNSIYKCLHIPLPSSYETFLRGIKHKDRKEMRRYLRRIEKRDFKIELIDCSDSSSISLGMNRLFELNQRRWHSKGLPSAFDDPLLCSFYLDIPNSFSNNKTLGLFCLRLSGKTVSVLFGFKYKGKYCVYETGMDPKYSCFSVGNFLFLKVIEKCIQEGLLEFDFMLGTDPYKLQFNPCEKRTCEPIVPNKWLLGALTSSLFSKYWQQGLRLKNFHRKYLERKRSLCTPSCRYPQE